jgi:hypothetical protein
VKKFRFWMMLCVLVMLFAVSCTPDAPTDEPDEATLCTVTLVFDYLDMVKELEIEKGALIEEPVRITQKPGYVSVGWFRQNGDEWELWDFATDTVSEDMTLTLRWERDVENTYRYALIYNDGTDRVDLGSNLKGADLPLPTPVWEGHTFLLWEWMLNTSYTTEDGEKIEVVYEARWANVPPNTRVMLGTYEQDGNEQNGAEPLEWLVVDRSEDGGAYLLTTRYIIDWLPFHNSSTTSLAWQQRDLRLWLNGTFYHTAFDDEARTHIPLTELPELQSKDHIFLLSEEEANLLFPALADRAGVLTPYAKMKEKSNPTPHSEQSGAYKFYGYWLRSAEKQTADLFFYSPDGSYINKKIDGNTHFGIRPAMWVDAAYVDALLSQQ